MRIKSNLFGLLAIITLSMLGGISGASAQGAHLHAVLVGGNETPNAGHPSAYGTAALNFRGTNLTQVCFAITFTGLTTPTGAHIHDGFGPQAGPIVVALATPTTGNPGFSAGCRTITAALSAQMRVFPQRFYINIHTAAPYATGAIRGQLFP